MTSVDRQTHPQSIKMKRRDFVLAASGLAGSVLAPRGIAATVQPCPPAQISVSGGTSASSVACPIGSSALDTLAASMSPGTWAQLSASALNVLGTLGSNGGVGGNMIPYSNQAVWDPITKAIRYCGNDHHGGTPGYTVMEVQYLAASNTWSIVTNQIPGITPSHGYGHIAIRPDTGELYVRQYAGGSGPETIFRKPLGGSWAGNLTSPTIYRQVAIGTGWWTGALSGSQAMGAYLMWCQGFGVIQIYDPGLDRWQQIDHPDPGGDGLYHGVLDYSPVKNVAVFGGGNAWPRKLWRLNSDRTVTALPDAPIDVGVQRANLNHDPVTGNFLIWGGGTRQLWELNPTTGVYTKLSGSRQPPAAGPSGVSDPAGGAGGPDALISCALPEQGVVAYMSASGASYANMFLYKHA